MPAPMKPDEYRARFPKHCKSCQGWGLCPRYGAKRWNGDGTPDEYDVCPDCEGQDLCPRCGAKRVFHEEGNPAEVRRYVSDYTSGYHENCPECGYVCSACGLDDASDGCVEVEC